MTEAEATTEIERKTETEAEAVTDNPATSKSGFTKLAITNSTLAVLPSAASLHTVHVHSATNYNTAASNLGPAISCHRITSSTALDTTEPDYTRYDKMMLWTWCIRSPSL